MTADRTGGGEDDCGCCEIDDFESTGVEDEPWCANCDHAPEDHGPEVAD